ncbi:MAG: HEAT repeat domain-containing protein [Deltaproteobacteria bacterium]|nr:HEAT repeat domain-containing protein [Deltaproteobacteria bacterium]
MSLTQDIKEFALDLGYSGVGVTTAEDFLDHQEEVRSRGEIYDFYTADPRRFLPGAAPRRHLATARSVIALAWDYWRTDFPPELVGRVGRIYQARCYGAPPHRINGARLRLLVEFLEKSGCQVGKGFWLPERRAAARAGVTTFGRNNFAHLPGTGSFILLASVVVDRELAYDEPTLRVKCPEGCTACLDACPTRAIYEPLKLNPRRCLAFNAWWTQDGRPGVSSYIPPEIREKMGVRVHGCDVCQEVCPRNAAKLKAKLPQDPFLTLLAGRFSLEQMLAMPPDFLARTVRPLMYNYINDKKYFQRNAAIALGNTGDPDHVPALAAALTDPEDLVRGYAAWALGRLGGRQARAALEAALLREDAAFARAEILAALAGGGEASASA